MPTSLSINDKDAAELKKSLDEIIPDIRMEEEHYRPRNAKLEREAKRVSSNVGLPQTPPTDIAYVAMSSRAPYNSDLREGEIRRALFFSGKNLEFELRDGVYASQDTRGSPQKANDYGITCFLELRGGLSKRKELQRNVETVIREFYRS